MARHIRDKNDANLYDRLKQKVFRECLTRNFLSYSRLYKFIRNFCLSYIYPKLRFTLE